MLIIVFDEYGKLIMDYVNGNAECLLASNIKDFMSIFKLDFEGNVKRKKFFITDLLLYNWKLLKLIKYITRN